MTAKQQSKFQWKLNLAVGLLLVLVLFAVVNSVSYKHFYRKNIAVSNYTKLSSLTINQLRQLPGELKLINFASPRSDITAALIYEDVDRVLSEYRYYAGKKISVEKVDPYFDLEQARGLTEKYKLTVDDNVLVVEYNGQWKALGYRDLATVSNTDAMMGGATPKVETFKAEQQITSAIQSLIQGRKSKVYFLTGHGEYDIKSDERSKEGYSSLRAYVERQNTQVEALNLAETGQIPADADMLVVAGPRLKYSAIEIELLDKYVQQQGGKGPRLMLLLDPDTESGLENFLKDYGVTFQNDMAMSKVMLLGQVKILPQAVATKFADHPAVMWLRKAGGNLSMGPARSLAVQPLPDKTKTTTVTTLVSTPSSFWGEVEYKSGSVEFNAAKDISGPLNLAVAVDSASVSDGQVQLKGGKIVAIGTGTLFMNQLIGQQQVDFFINIMNWMLEGGKPFGISPKVPQEFAANLEMKDLWTLAGILLLFPLTAAAVAVLVWLRRRN